MLTTPITLIVVDCQNDFCLPDAPLCVPGGLEAIAHIVSLIRSERVDNIIFTVDWHPSTHCSFKENGGIWPVHCLQYTTGAAIHPSLLTTCREMNIPYQVVPKGMTPNEEEYGACRFITDTATHHLIRTPLGHCSISKSLPIVVCGIAGDYCVLETLRNLSPLHPQVFLRGVASIDGGKALSVYMNKQVKSYG